MHSKTQQQLTREALTEDEVAACFGVIKQLRPLLKRDEFVRRVAEQRKEGYRIAYIQMGSMIVCVAGFRIMHNLSWGKFLYVDDLSTDASYRSKGYGMELLHWLRNEARHLRCNQLHLDSGIQRIDAHRFYAREGLEKTCYHFAETL